MVFSRPDPSSSDSPYRSEDKGIAFQEVATDSELLAIFLQTRSPDAAERLVRRHSPLVVGVVRRMLHHRNDAEDAFQATFLILFQSADKIRDRASLAAWLYGVAYRTAHRVRQRANQDRGYLMNHPFREPSEIDNPLEKIAHDAQLELLDRELQALQPSLRESLIEYYLLGFTAPQIADRLSLSVSAIEGRLRRGRALLRQRLARRGISFSVSVAIATAYQQQTVAASLPDWKDHLLHSELFSQAVDTQPFSSTDSTLLPLIQGELAMKSTLVGGATFAVAVACTTLTLGGLALAWATGKESTDSRRSIVSTVTQDPLVAELTIDPSAKPALSDPVKTRSAESSSSSLNSVLSQTGTLLLSGTDSPGSSGLGGGPTADTRKIVVFTKPSGPIPNWMINGGTLAQEEAAAREQVRLAIRKKVHIDFNQTPLRTILENLAEQTQMPIQFDRASIEQSGTSLEDPMTFTHLPEMSLQRALQIILRELELAYVIEPEHILITTKAERRSQTLRTYDLAYLLPTNEKMEELIHLIQTSISASWERDGGADSIVQFGSMLIVKSPEETHLAIEGLLFELSKMNKENF